MHCTLSRLAATVAACALAFSITGGASAFAAQDAGASDGGLTAATIQTQAKKPKATKKAKLKRAYTKQTTKLDVEAYAGKVVADGSYAVSAAPQVSLKLGVSKSKPRVVPAKSATKVWRLSFDKPTQAYQVVNVKTGKALSVAPKPKKGSAVSLLKRGSVASVRQLWKVTATSGGYRLSPVANKSLSLEIAKASKGATVRLASTSGSARQRFWLQRGSGDVLKDGTYSLTSSKGKLLTVPGSSLATRQLATSVNGGGASQMFEVHATSGTWYRIKNVNSGKYVAAASKGRVIQASYKGKGGSAQLWKAELGASGVRFKNMKTGTYLGCASKGAARLVKRSSASSQWTVSPTVPTMSTVALKALYRANKLTSTTQYCIVVDMTSHDLMLFKKMYPKRKGGPWMLADSWAVSTGRNKCTRAMKSRLGSKALRHSGFSCWYWSAAQGGSFFHSVLYRSGSMTQVSDGRLRQYVSSGCIRMKIQNAKFIYDKVPSGTTILRYYK